MEGCLSLPRQGGVKSKETVFDIEQITIYILSKILWKGVWVVERDGLENRCTLAGTVGSNPTPTVYVKRAEI